MVERQQVLHGIDPVYDRHCRVLMLGTMPSPKSREVGFYYGNPQNRFWRVMAKVVGEGVPQSIEEKKSMLLRHRIALWDVLATCEIEGASDASIRNARPNNLRLISDVAPIEAVLCTGSKSAQLYRRLCEDAVGLPCVALPSTSPANAAYSEDRLLDAYREALLPYLGKR